MNYSALHQVLSLNLSQWLAEHRAQVSQDAAVLLSGKALLQANDSNLSPLKGVACFALANEIAALGITPTTSLTVINDEQWVALTLAAKQVITW
ncbi:hypothetical protein CWI84_00365 [Idiomarina tyrosinivorans]|uniref:Sulfurtransferase complex subunit TusB n=1 Tax=Idiomarina tyrosinivorans TaxID=1445662 RepID=A0A432ZTJ5_9GAMM|nr:hypothetical protein [Idiomarina tyrosinivorans]RUO81254.1 hypothetical protein CWI84_00365 [Idiomarina tyrosinivorans]